MSRVKSLIENIIEGKRIRVKYIEPKGYIAAEGIIRRFVEGTLISKNGTFIVINNGRYKTTINYDMIEGVNEIDRKKRAV